MTALREASSVILLRRADQGFEVFMLRRHRGASFMASAFVFPGGTAEPGEDARTTAARELFEEAGILLAKDTDEAADTLEIMSMKLLRKRLNGGEPASDVLASAKLAWAPEPLAPWSHWITPSVEPKRFSARFFVCELPPGQVPTFDAVETVEQLWVRPADAIARAGELALPPPQIRTCWELAEHDTIDQVLAAAATRAEEPHPIMPRLRMAAPGEKPCLLLPWDPEYTTHATGDSTPFAYTPAWARGPSRFVMEGRAWKHVAAPGSTTADS
ncbi:MAG TPA: NUDIX domain-containing protein [Kofleriaceae bacterium]|nr:NUDIX domain-containing protein [Kofleriaceae bacterium]